MEAYKRGGHTVWECKYHLAWVTKYRYPVLGRCVARGATFEGPQFAQAAERVRLLRKRYWGQHLWARGCWVVSSGNVTDDVWVEYIKNQAPPEPDDNFMSREWLPCPPNGEPIRL